MILPTGIDFSSSDELETKTGNTSVLELFDKNKGYSDIIQRSTKTLIQGKQPVGHQVSKKRTVKAMEAAKEKVECKSDRKKRRKK